ncbi:uroporphyrinogen decarboxylase [Candidatus Magnetoovum chiemensis]|nr:uroporphyrinogen decarboxylase [Candidatus Magnetoovum chiemensis]
MNDTFIKTCKGEKTNYTPVWIMRQAGRYLPQYKKVRNTVDFLTLCKTPELAAEVTLQPVDILGVDAAILFSDILIPVEAMGIELEFSDKIGPVINNPVRDMDAAKELKVINPKEDVPFVIETIKILTKELNKKAPLIGFAGAPFTILTYIVEGGSSKNFLITKKLIYQEPALFNIIMDKITQSMLSYLTAQIEAGADAVQLFDTWAGVLCPCDYKNMALPYVNRIVSALKKLNVPIIYFVNNCAGILDEAVSAGSDVIGIDWRIDLDKALKSIPNEMAVQGNLDPCVLFSSKDHIRKEVSNILKNAQNSKGHIFNLGHGILPETPVDNVKYLVNTVHELGVK